MDMILP